MYSYLKTNELATSIKSGIDNWEGLTPQNRSNISDIQRRIIISPEIGPIRQSFITMSDYSGSDTLESRLVQYVTTSMPSEKQVLALIMEMCTWEPQTGPKILNLSFLNIRAIVEVLKNRNAAVFYLYALEIYQSILLENITVDGAVDDLCNLPIITNKGGSMGDCRVSSICIQAEAFEELKRFSKAVNLYKEIDSNDPQEFQEIAAKKIKELTPLAQKETGCIIL